MSVQPARVPADDFSLFEVVRAALEGGEPDPYRVAADVIASLSLADARAALAATLPSYVRDVIRDQRRGRVRVASPAAAPTSARWDNVAELHASGELTLLRQRVFAQGAWKFLGDCTREDVQAIAEDRDVLAAENAAAADRYRRLRAAMGRRKATVVRDLPADVLTRIFDAA